jgi:ArsR family transcriptional regulator
MFGEDMAYLKARFFKALSDRSRILILETLSRREWMSVGDICEITDIEQSTVSHHLGFLRNCGLVRTRKRGKQVFYSLNGRIAEKLLFMSETHVRSLAEKLISGHA